METLFPISNSMTNHNFKQFILITIDNVKLKQMIYYLEYVQFRVDYHPLIVIDVQSFKIYNYSKYFQQLDFHKTFHYTRMSTYSSTFLPLISKIHLNQMALPNVLVTKEWGHSEINVPLHKF